MKITPRDRQILGLLKQGISPKEAAGIIGIAPRTLKQHLRTLYLRAHIDPKKHRKLQVLFTLLYGAELNEEKLSRLQPHEVEHARLVCSGLTDEEVAGQFKITRQVGKNKLRRIYDTLGVSSRLELRTMLMPQGEVRA